MASDNGYRPQSTVDWNSDNSFSQFKLWRKEVERIIDGPLASRSERVKVNHIFIWAGAHAELLIEAKQNEDPNLDVSTTPNLLNALASCLTHSTHFREAREEFYSLKQKPGENTTAFYSRIMEVYRQCSFPAQEYHRQDPRRLPADTLACFRLIRGCRAARSQTSTRQSATIAFV